MNLHTNTLTQVTWLGLRRRLLQIKKKGRAEYRVFWRLLNSQNHGVPQHRPRVYVIGLRKDAQVCKFKWPAKTQQTDLGLFLRTQMQDWPGQAAPPRPMSKTNARNLALGLQTLRQDGLNPEATDAVIDIGHGRKGKVAMMIGRCPAITRTRAATQDYYLTSMRRRLSESELMSLQGLKPHEAKIFHGISRRQKMMMVGNGMTINVLTGVLRQSLRATGLI